MGERFTEFLRKGFGGVLKAAPFQGGEHFVVDLLARLFQYALAVQEGAPCGPRLFDLAAKSARLRCVCMVA